MFLLLVRMSPLIITTTVVGLLLAEGVVTTATAERSITCRQAIHAQLIRELWTRTNQLIQTLPKEEHFSRRLLPRFCTKCLERKIGWLEIQELIDVYQRSVFSKKVVQKLLPLHYNGLLHRLQHTLQRCVSSPGPSRWYETIRKLERKIKKRGREDKALKAVSEFTYILRWMDELAKHHVYRSTFKSL